MNGRAAFDDESWLQRVGIVRRTIGIEEENFMIGAMGFLVAVAAVSAILFALMMRADNKRLSRSRSRGGSSYDGGGSFDTNSSSVASWFGFSSLSDVSGNAADSVCASGSWDSGSSDS